MTSTHGNLRPALALALAALAALTAAAACGGEEEHWGEGVVREVERDRGRVVIEHGAIPGLMGAMTMGFAVAEPALLEGMEPGAEVRFRVEYEGGSYRILAIEEQGVSPAAPGP